MIRPITLDDAEEICEIYNHYILHTVITFEMEPVTKEEMQNRISYITSKFPWFVYEEEGEIIGYAYATDWRMRSAYKQTVESTVYLKHDAIKKGIGTLLYKELIDHLIAKDFHVIIGGIALPNEPSVVLHEKFGFKKTAHFHEVGYKFNNWVDVGYWELLVNNPLI